MKPKMLTKVANVYFSKHFFMDGLSKSSDHIVDGAVDLSFKTYIFRSFEVPTLVS